MKKYMSFLISISLLLAPITLFAETVSRPGVFPQNPPVTGFNELLGFLDNILNFVAKAFIVIAVIIFLWTAFLFLTAGDNEDQQKRAKKFLFWGLIAIVVSLFSFGIFAFVKSVIEGNAGGATSP